MSIVKHQPVSLHHATHINMVLSYMSIVKHQPVSLHHATHSHTVLLSGTNTASLRHATQIHSALIEDPPGQPAPLLLHYYNIYMALKQHLLKALYKARI